MRKVLTVALGLSFMLLINNSKVYAQEFAVGSSAALFNSDNLKISDSRGRILKKFLEEFNSPLAPFAETFVENADKYNLDWKLVAAISGVESTFGQQIPNNSFNGWGWGIYGDNVIRFSSWEEGIQTVSEGLRTKYINQWKAKDIYEIGKMYAASPTWAVRVGYFMDKIEEYKNLSMVNLSISL